MALSTRIIESPICMGYCSELCRVMKLPTVIWLPKPITLSRIECLNPSTTPTDTIITASPMATPMVAIVMAGRDTCRCPLLSE